jgi:signal-transduction protein with cAMP-binding, CBS, and nucleotidyltransferase domain
MRVSDVAIREAVTAPPDMEIGRVAALMASAGVGSVVIVDRDQLTGIVTDRDIVVRAVARHVPLDARIDSVMSMNVIAIDAQADINQAIATFGHEPVRRLPVVDHDRVIGLVSLDDLVVALTGALADLARGVNAQLLFPHARDEAAVPATA